MEKQIIIYQDRKPKSIKYFTLQILLSVYMQLYATWQIFTLLLHCSSLFKIFVNDNTCF